MDHPNFPPSLFITPNVGRVLGHPLKNDNEGTFGVEAQREAILRYGIAGRVWEAAYSLCIYVDPADDFVYDFNPPFVGDLNEPLGVIELGSGTGVVAASIVRKIRRAPVLGGFVIATDLPDVCPLLRRNLDIETPGMGIRPELNTVFVRPLAWGNRDHALSIVHELSALRLTHVVCSDLVYFPELFGPLLRTLIHLTSPPLPGPLIKVVISCKIRSLAKETPFWSAFGLWFSFQPVLVRRRVQGIENENEPLDGDFDVSVSWRRFEAGEDTDRILVFVAYRRPESITWHVPETDKELVEGLGARGTMSKKGDDTFETILFMGIAIDE